MTDPRLHETPTPKIVTRDQFSRLRAGERLRDLTDERVYVVRASYPHCVEAADDRFEVFELIYRESFELLPPLTDPNPPENALISETLRRAA